MLDRTVEERHSKPFRLNLDDGKSLISHQWLDGSAVGLLRISHIQKVDFQLTL